ncbi:terpene cyclase/mutase family protein [Alicyclobacillus dauci]|uniref:Squalene--hopene cyclase n=1 Tax=Alicyclobacillus dauci TaxID=1475485 RepID=A0ABY6Z5E6_9BACL|nr:prenyltransferase/squalene oxidase repeat-containing protein [Alicyclobacillus dauci]WAH37852.1 squalene--hopene cyclase [Alicyclobacillus dauci]
MYDHLIKTAIDNAARRILMHQREDGAFVFWNELNPLSDAVTVIFLSLIGQADDPLIPQLCRDLIEGQQADGTWVAYPDQESNVSATVLAYFALKLARYPVPPERMAAARQMILHHGGINRASNLTKIILAIAGQIPWTDLPYPFIDVVLWEPDAFVSIYDFASFTRLHMVPFMLLSHLQFHYNLPEEVGVKDLVHPSFHLSIPRLPQKHDEAINRCREFILGRLEVNGTLASYHLATVLAAFALKAVGRPEDAGVIERAITGLKGMVVRRGGAVIQQQFTSTVWDTSLSMQALIATRNPITHDALNRGARYLLSRQSTRASDWHVHAPKARPGGWGFSDVNLMYPDVDDTIAALGALYPFKHSHSLAWRRGANWVLAMQNDDGGWSPFDHNSNKAWLEHIPINDMGRAMTDPSTADITGRVLATIASTHIHAPSAVADGVQWLLRHQRDDGSWFGRWGIAFIYGTWAAVQGLRLCGLPEGTSAMQRALAFLEGIQHDDGGFGESCKSHEVDSFTPLSTSTPSQTAWGLMAMMFASPRRTKRIDRAAEYLLSHTVRRGGWYERYPTGAAVAGQAYVRYHSYPYVWPILALNIYRRRYF